MSFLYLIIALLALAIMIFVHELGHYTAGRILGFKILDFSLGFGPAIFQFKKNDINYAVRAIPLGGACRFYGEEDDPQDAVAFYSQKPWKRLIVIFAGPLMNFIFAYLLSFLMILTIGAQKDSIVLSDVSADSPAMVCGLQKDDTIVKINGNDIYGKDLDYNTQLEIISKEIASAPAEGISITVLRSGEEKEIFVSDIYNETQQKNLLGITMGAIVDYERVPFFRTFGKAGKYLYDIVKQTFLAIAKGFKEGFHEGEVTSIVGTIAITVNVMLKGGISLIIPIMIVISMSLGIMNLLPLLPLDGGHLLFDFIELVVGKPVPRSIQNILSIIGFGLLILLMIVTMVSDVKGLFNGLFNVE